MPAKVKIPAPPLLKFDWHPPGPVAKEFVKSDALLCGIRGPFGSGKSVACIAKLLRNFSQQKPGPDGIVRRRSAIIRNTYGELGTTTIKTWNEWVPRTVGHWSDKAPPVHSIKVPGVDWEILFVALDRPEDLKKLLSMDLSDAWINEAREIPKAILDGLTGRVGRYPRTVRSAQGDVLLTCAAPQVIMDTNPPDSDHWWAKMADFPDLEVAARNEEVREQLLTIGMLREGQPLQEFFSQPSGRQQGAENLKNLIPGYYERLMAGKSEDWIKVYVDGNYGFVQDGKSVYPEYNDSVHCKEFSLNRALPIYVGIDFGRTPAATFAQRTVMGAWRIHSEVVTEDMDALEFGKLLSVVLQERYAGYKVAGITGDPAGDARAQSDSTTPFKMLAVSGIEARKAHTNDPEIRRTTFAQFLNKMMSGEPGLIVHPNCVKLRKALAGGYHYRRIQVAGEERFHDEPVKDAWSHVAEAAQYMLLGAGEARVVMRANPELYRNRPKFADGVGRNPFDR